MAENFRVPLFEPLGRPVFWAPPLFHFITAFLYKIFGTLGTDVGLWGAKMVSPIFAGLTLIYVFLLAKKLYDTRIAFYATLFLSFIPLHLYLSTIPYQDVAVGFFVLAAVFHLMEKKPTISGIFVGFALSTKYTAVFIYPLILYVLFYMYPNKKKWLQAGALFLVASLIVGGGWYARNYVILGNPLWPHMDAVLGRETATNLDHSFLIQGDFQPKIRHVFKWDFMTRNYLSLYGVPGGGDISNFSFISLPFGSVIVFIWFIGTILFSLPFLSYAATISLKDRKFWLLVIWFFSFFSFAILNKMVNDLVYLRHSMPVIVPLALAWAIGFTTLIKKSNTRFRSAIKILLVFLLLGFCIVELTKMTVTLNLWNGHHRN